jgi:hypothetical protein
MPVFERVGNIHIHTTLSDGTADHAQLAQIAREAGLDFLILTDHNAYAGDRQGWYEGVLVLVGEEVHNPAQPQANHFLALNIAEDMAPYGEAPQALVTAVRERGGLGFIAHPYEHSGPFAHEPEINWLNWEVQGYHGLEVWNYMSEFKSYLRDLPTSVLLAYWPKLAIRGPYAETLARWDALLAQGPVYALGGTDAHATTYRLGPLVRQVFSYAHLFRTVNTHLLLAEPWRNDAAHDAQLVYEALGHGRAFIAYDGLAPGKGFSFWAESRQGQHALGEAFIAQGAVRFRVQAPARARLRLLHNGFCVAEKVGTALEYVSRAPGAYRVEAYRPYLLRQRTWILSNPILVQTQPKGPEAG